MKQNAQILHISGTELLFAVLAWSLLILRFGYRYGTGDQVELLPYTLYLHDTTLYPLDFFIQHLHASVPNERTVMATLLLPFVKHLELFSFLFQGLSTILLVLGLQKLGRRFITNRYFVWAAILIALIPLNDFTLGNVELYSECFQASGLATGIVVWALLFFLDSKYVAASALMAAATIIQLLDGLDVMIVLTLILFIALVRRQVTVKTFLLFTGIYALTAGVYLVFIFIQKSAGTGASPAEVFSILFQFRHPHHFIFSAFGKLKTVVFFALGITALVFYGLRSSKIFQFVLIGLVGVVVYAIAVDVFHIIFVANFQFYKVTGWIKFFGVVAALGLLEEVFNWQTVLARMRSLQTAGMVLGIACCWVVIIKFNTALPYRVPFQFFGMKNSDEMIDICRQINAVTPANAVFIQPFENTELKFYARRSSYVEFKANVRNKAFIKQWAGRINEVYNVGPESDIKGFALESAADSFYYAMSAERLLQLKCEGVTHLLTKKEYKPATGNLILVNSAYAVYQL